MSVSSTSLAFDLQDQLRSLRNNLALVQSRAFYALGKTPLTEDIQELQLQAEELEDTLNALLAQQSIELQNDICFGEEVAGNMLKLALLACKPTKAEDIPASAMTQEYAHHAISGE